MLTINDFVIFAKSHIIMNNHSAENLSLSISPFLMKDLVGMVMKRKSLPFEDALHYIMSSRMYENLMDEGTKTWYLSSSALYDLLEEEKAKLRPQTLDNKVLLFQMFCIENYKAEKGLTPNEVMELFSQNNVYNFLKETYETLHTQDREYILNSISTFIKKRK